MEGFFFICFLHFFFPPTSPMQPEGMRLRAVMEVSGPGSPPQGCPAALGPRGEGFLWGYVPTIPKKLVRGSRGAAEPRRWCDLSPAWLGGPLPSWLVAPWDAGRSHYVTAASW